MSILDRNNEFGDSIFVDAEGSPANNEPVPMSFELPDGGKLHEASDYMVKI